MRKVYIDGEENASIWGTGTEDYFLSAWGLKRTSTPYFGVPYFDQWGIVGGHTSAYRWHINDPLVFNKGIKVTIEHFGWMSPDENPQYRSHSWNEREDDYSSVAFWYQTGEPTFTARAPHARERTLPNLDRLIVAARNFTDEKHHGQGEAVAQNLDLYPKGHLLYKPRQQENAWVEIPFEIEKKEPLRLLLVMTHAGDYGKYQASLNGVKLGGVDRSLRFRGLDPRAPPAGLLARAGQVHLAAGVRGQERFFERLLSRLESVRLRERRPRVRDYHHDAGKDWHTNPVLYE